jgi:hypothetical protein
VWVAQALRLDHDGDRKPIALSVDGHNQAVVASVLAQDLAQQIDVLRDVSVCHHSVRPNLQRDFVSVHDAAVRLDEHQEDLKDPLGHRNNVTLLEEEPVRHFEPELSEPVRCRSAAWRLNIKEFQCHTATLSWRRAQVIKKSKKRSLSEIA